MVTLDKWLKHWLKVKAEPKRTKAMFAREAGISPQMLQHALHGTIPGPKVMAGIKHATNGEVTADSFYSQQPRRT